MGRKVGGLRKILKVGRGGVDPTKKFGPREGGLRK